VAYQFGGISLVVDKRIKSYLFEYAVRFFTLALSCCKDLPDERPKMAEVAKELEYIDFMLLEPDSKRTEYVTSDSSSTLLNSQPSSSTIKILHLFQEMCQVVTLLVEVYQPSSQDRS